MTIIPGINYFETKALLIEKIRDREVPLVNNTLDVTCYFCLEHRPGARAIDSERINQRARKSTYSVCFICLSDIYESAKQTDYNTTQS